MVIFSDFHPLKTDALKTQNQLNIYLFTYPDFVGVYKIVKYPFAWLNEGKPQMFININSKLRGSLTHAKTLAR